MASIGFNNTILFAISTLSICCLIRFSNCQQTKDSIKSVTQQTTTSWLPLVPRDEFNITESPHVAKRLAEDIKASTDVPLQSLKRLLLRQTYNDCCLAWKNLTENHEVQEEWARRNGKKKGTTMKASDLLNELKRTFYNITYLSIDGQSGNNEREQYYNFYDAVQYYLRLMKVAHDYLDASNVGKPAQEIDFDKVFRRQLRSIEFRITRDPTLASFMRELKLETTGTNSSALLMNPNFEFYEDFIRYTEFGQYYAKNISMIRESVLVFDQICSHLTSTSFPSNFTRPSKQYEMIRRMSYELYFIQKELNDQINPRVIGNRADLRRIFGKLDELAQERPDIRMLGDEFSSNPPYFSSNVRKLTHMLNQYLTNNLTQVSFYDQLAVLPEDFIVLGSSIAHHYENTEIPQYSRFDQDYFNWQTTTYQSNSNSNNHNSTSDPTDARRSNLSIFTRLFS